MLELSESKMSLFACTLCHSRHPFEELSKGDQLCKKCRKAHPLVTCIYCRMEFHLSGGTEGKPVCKKCNGYIKKHGQPTCCEYCNIRAAFNGTKCSRCESSERKYGPPIVCEQCKLKCAFQKSDESKDKVDGKILCLLCTLAYKRLVHKSKKEGGELLRGSNSHSHKRSLKREGHHRHHHHHSKHEKRSKTEHNDVSGIGGSDVKPQGSAASGMGWDSPALGLYTNSGNSDAGAEPVMSDHMAELTELKELVVKLKKQLQQKNQALIEKEKKMTELKAENWEKEKEFKKKILSLQRELGERLEALQNDNRNLKKQLVVSSKSGKDKTSDS
ncbi:protein FAM76B-like isoform X2 [Actinia tenebrosa]|uniref:Protein FAM76B-like isoform X2 n=1 Tax=Actinia tenebrosa TaxID=6105 RepID=A0A6P8IML3_ACTTE|nr:protein FAM76B-like isoform X2 [Actinia tenebrosa]